jgi:acyl dehydratase
MLQRANEGLFAMNRRERTLDIRANSGSGGANSGFVNAWLRATGHLLNSALELNRALLAVYGFGLTDGAAPDVAAPIRVAERSDGRIEAPDLPSLAYTRGEWSSERSVDSADEITVGDTVTFTKALTDEDVAAFAEASGDTNRLHLDDDFAAGTRFGDRIAHGTLVSGLISAALARLPGLTIYLSQDVKFLRPVYIGDVLTATVEVIEDLDGDRYVLSTDVHDEDGKLIIEGEAVVLIDSLPEGATSDR